jgi:hypothetical protein
MSRIDPGQTARRHGPATLAAVTAIPHLIRGRRSGAEKGRDCDDGKHAESLFPDHELLLPLTSSRLRSLGGTSYSSIATVIAAAARLPARNPDCESPD